MALGGYKFAGYKCTKPSGATDAQWALLIHKTRLKAFLAANTAASAGWSFDWSNGDEAFETYGNVIYYADGTDPLNLVSFFKHGSGDDTKYYMIASLFNWSATVETDVMRISNYGPILPGQYKDNNNNYWKVGYRTLFHTVSYDRFPEDCLTYTANNYPSRAIPLIPLGGWYTPTATVPRSYPSLDTGSYFKANVLYIGCACKDLNIISFISNLISGSNYYQFCRNTVVGFESLNLSSPSDTANIYGITIASTSNGYETSGIVWDSGSLSGYNETLKSNFERYIEASKANWLALTKASRACFNGVVTSYPFEDVTLTTFGIRTAPPYLNSDGISSKGSFNIDLLSCNGTYNYTAFSQWASVANGNYLTALYYSHEGNASSPQTTYYVGWDPSNPDITSEDAWTAYDGT